MWRKSIYEIWFWIFCVEWLKFFENDVVTCVLAFENVVCEMDSDNDLLNWAGFFWLHECDEDLV